MRQLTLIFFPLFFLFYVGFVAFAIKAVDVAMTLPLATIGGLFSYSFVIQTLTPQTGYFMMSDYILLFFLISSFLAFIASSLTAIPEHILQKKTILQIEGLTVILLHIALILVWYYLMFKYALSM